MVKELKRVFLRGNEEVLGACDAEALAACEAAATLDEFMAAHAPFALRRRGVLRLWPLRYVSPPPVFSQYQGFLS